MKHTKGPWKVFKGADRYIIDLNGESYWIQREGFSGNDEQRANANLIAAAPDLLEALEILVAHAPNKASEQVFRKLIAKAKGGAE